MAAQTITDYDTDNNGLIDITTLAQLNAIRHDLNGNGDATHADYVAAFPNRDTNAATRMGCPSGTCTGYELMNDLDFDENDNGSRDDTYNTGGGWNPIGTTSAFFTATFNGNGYTIANLFINRSGTDYMALFGVASTATIENLGLVNVNVTGDGDTSSLVGLASQSTIRACYATGTVTGSQAVGGLVGNFSGTLTAGYARVRVVSTNSIMTNPAVGGLAGGVAFGGTITASYALGRVTGTSVNTMLGGLVGNIGRGGATVTNSYWDTETTGQSSSDGGTGYTTTQLQTPTGYTGIYANWNVNVDGVTGNDNPWAFGTDSQYPVLRYGRTQAQINAQFNLQPRVILSLTRLNLIEDSSGNYTVLLNTQPTGNVTVTVASDNTDVTTGPGALTFTNSDWATAQTVTVNAGQDPDSLNETATLSHTVSGYGGVTTVPSVRVVVTDNTPGIIVDPVAGLTTTEAGASDTFTVVLSTQPTDSVTISLSSNATDEGTVMPTSLSFATAAWDTAQTVTVTGQDDDVDDGDQPYTITLDPSSGDANYDGLSSVTVSVTNADDDLTGVTATPSTSLTTGENGTAVTFTVELNTEPTAPVTISLSSNATDEGTVMPTSLSFAAAAWDTAQIVTVTGQDDDVDDGDQPYTITLDPSSGDTNYAGLSSVTVSVTNADDDVTGVTATPSTGLTTGENGTAVTFTVELNTEPTAPVTISLSSNATDEGTVMPTSLSFATTAWDTAQIVTVTGQDDDIDDGDQPYTITLDPNSGDANYAGLSSVTVSVTNADNDVAGVTLSETRLNLTEGSSGNYTMNLNTQPTGNVTVTIASDNSDVTTGPGALTFSNSDWETAQTVTVNARRDNDSRNDTATLSHGVIGYGTVTSAPAVTVMVNETLIPDVDGDNDIDAEDAIILFIYTLGNSPQAQEDLLQQQIGNSDPAAQAQALARANAWESSGALGDLNLDGPVDNEDALIIYYAKQFGDLLQAPGQATLRRLLLDDLRGNVPATDADYIQLLRRATE